MAKRKTLSIEELQQILRCEIEYTVVGVVVRVSSGFAIWIFRSASVREYV